MFDLPSTRSVIEAPPRGAAPVAPAAAPGTFISLPLALPLYAWLDSLSIARAARRADKLPDLNSADLAGCLKSIERDGAAARSDDLYDSVCKALWGAAPSSWPERDRRPKVLAHAADEERAYDDRSN
jgi:hypothetical protein